MDTEYMVQMMKSQVAGTAIIFRIVTSIALIIVAEQMHGTGTRGQKGWNRYGFDQRF